MNESKYTPKTFRYIKKKKNTNMKSMNELLYIKISKYIIEKKDKFPENHLVLIKIKFAVYLI